MQLRAQKKPGHRVRPRGNTTISSRQKALEVDTQLSYTSDYESEAPTAQLTSEFDKSASQVNPYFGLRRNRVPRCRCGTCGFRDCTCIVALDKSPTIPTRPPKAPLPLIQNGKILASRVFIRAEKTYTGLGRERIFPVDVNLEEMSKFKIAEEPCPRLKE